jgi:hypothetical protein
VRLGPLKYWRKRAVEIVLNIVIVVAIAGYVSDFDLIASNREFTAVVEDVYPDCFPRACHLDDIDRACDECRVGLAQRVPGQ